MGKHDPLKAASPANLRPAPFVDNAQGFGYDPGAASAMGREVSFEIRKRF
jgi:hypothetical protein